MDISSVLGLGSLGLSLFARAESRNLYRQQENSYAVQAALNQRIGQFNAEMAERTGKTAMYNILEQTKRIMGKQIVEFSNRGIELDGSPMLVLGDTAEMGQAEAQGAYFNAQVNKINYQFAAQNATATAMSNASAARFGALGQTLQLAQDLKAGYNLLQSMFKNPAGAGANSTLGAISQEMRKS